MKSRLGEVLSLEEMAAEANYSPSYFGQKFRQQTGFTPMDYFNQLKIRKACQELDFSDKRMKEIAYELRFFDQYHFSKVFYKHVGTSPTQYKNRKKVKFAYITQKFINLTATSSGQPNYPVYPYHGKVAQGKSLVALARDVLGWSADVWDFSGELPTLK